MIKKITKLSVSLVVMEKKNTLNLIVLSVHIVSLLFMLLDSNASLAPNLQHQLQLFFLICQKSKAN